MFVVEVFIVLSLAKTQVFTTLKSYFDRHYETKDGGANTPPCRQTFSIE